ncbi:nuclear transport factor 2 family protein [Paraglaciecola arctica]|uniref:Lumazine-binding n=1 Tax=Paraglaciecola arctica BSs20135 TaxID=493475 RepID=K6YHK7_9ALTE|nr:nuclear transport factor 2 family protein [Paraglaciecola arctica]GAC17662.1 hypothetical protein GARC_0681 [Paraglaciecola arctica BSs20135]
MTNKLFISILLLLTFGLNAQQSTPVNDIESITVPLENYLGGHLKGDKSMLGKALHSEGKLSYLRDGKYAKLEFPDYLSGMKLRNLDDGVRRIPYIKSIEVTGNVAIAKLVLDYSSILFTDYMTLLNINGEWKITNKIAYSVRDPQNNKVERANIIEVMAPLKRYMLAYNNGDTEHLSAVFHNKANIMSISKGQYKTLTLKRYIESFKHLKSKGEGMISHQIQSIDTTGNAAIAKVILNFPNSIITQYLSLLKIDGEWKIVNNAFDIIPSTALKII